MKVEAEGYYTKEVEFAVSEYKNTYPKLTFLDIVLQNSSIYTTTEEPTTTTSTITTTVRQNLSDRIGFVEEFEKIVPVTVVEMLRSSPSRSEAISVDQISLQTVLFLCTHLYIF